MVTKNTSATGTSKTTKNNTTTTTSSTVAKKQPTAAEMREWYEKNNKNKINYAKAEDALKNLRDTTKSTTYRTISNFNKEDLRTYLQNVSNYEVNLRNLSRYLYYRSQVYYRIIAYNSNMFCLNARSVIPKYSLVEDNDKETILKSYNDTLDAIDKMNLQYEFLKAYMTCFREDVFYGIYYFNPESEANTSFFILPLDPDYCKITGVWETGDFAFTMDMSYFKRNQDLLEYWGEPFQSLYKEYQSDNIKMKLIPQEYGLCLKAHAEDWETVVPVFSGLLNSLISLIDQEDIAAIADEQSIYKLVWMELETLTGATDPNDWKVDPELCLPYWDRMVDEALPPYISGAIVPGKLNSISFPDNQDTEVNRVENATKAVLNTSGGSQILQSSSISGTTAFNAALRSDTEFAISMLLPQTEMIVNRILSLYIDNPSRVKFLEVSTYTKDAYKESILKDNTYGLAPKLLVNTLNGFSEKETLALNFLESECLNLNFTPVQSSHTTSNSGDDEGGAPEKSTSGGVDSITDSGEDSQDKRDNANG
jgi:hypothetical protein